MYKTTRQVQFSECAPDGFLRYSKIVDYFQDCSTQQSESLHVGMAYTASRHTAWILSAWQVCIKKRPAMGESVQVATWPYDFSGFYGYRNYTLTDESGQVLAYANAVWVCMDPAKGRPCRPGEREIQAYQTEPPYPMAVAPRKIAVPEQRMVQEAVRVSRIHLDCNGHMNNVKYIEMAMECLPDGFSPSQIRVDYRRQARYGDRIIPEVHTEENKMTVVLCDTDGTAYATIEFTGEEKR